MKFFSSTSTTSTLVTALAAASVLGAVAAQAQSMVRVSLWQTYVNEAGTTLFWDDATAPILADSPEFLHTRQSAPTGVAYEIDITETTMTIQAINVEESTMSVMPAGQYDRYYLFIDNTLSLEEANLHAAAPQGVSVQVLSKGTFLNVQDRSYPIDMEVELKQDTVLIELGPGTPLNDSNFKVQVDYKRIAGPSEDNPEQKNALFPDSAEKGAPSSTRAVTTTVATALVATTVAAAACLFF